MRVLAFDTCLGAVSVAVRGKDAHGAWLVHEAYELLSAGHAERLMPMIASVMGDAGLAFRDLDRLAVTIGPGGFTGVRVGVAAARGLALASRLPVAGTTSLAVMAHGADQLLGDARGDRLLAVAVDARRGMTYFQLFGHAQEAIGAALLLAPADVPTMLGARPVVVVGSAALAVVAAIAAAGGDAQAALPDLQPHARSLALLAAGLVPASPLEPLYLRPPDAKPQGDKSLSRAAP